MRGLEGIRRAYLVDLLVLPVLISLVATITNGAVFCGDFIARILDFEVVEGSFDLERGVSSVSIAYDGQRRKFRKSLWSDYERLGSLGLHGCSSL